MPTSCLIARRRRVSMILSTSLALGGWIGAAHAQPANDLCNQAIHVNAGEPVSGTSEGATSDLPAAPCGFSDDKDVWFEFQAPSAGRYRIQFLIDIFSTLYQPSLAVLSTCGGTTLACADDPGPDRLDVNLTDGQEVLVRVAGTDGATGSFTLLIDHAPPPPVNDECLGAAPLALNDMTFGDTYEATPSTTASTCNSGLRDTWFEFTAPADGVYHALMPNRGMRMSVYRGGCDGSFELFCDSLCGEYSRAIVPLNASQKMWIRSAACDGSETSFAVRVDDFAPPANDECAGAAPITAGATVPGTTRGATGDVDPNPVCAERDLFDVWYTFTSPASGTLMYRFVVNPVGEFDPAITVLDGCNGTPLACDDNAGAGLAASVSLPLTPGQSVRIRIAGVDVSDGDFTLSASVGAPPPVNDECGGAIALTPGGSTFGSTALASGFGDFLSPCALEDDIDVWYTLTNPASESRIFTIDTIGTTDLELPSLAAFDGCNGAVLACNTSHFLIGPDARIDVILAPAQTMLLRVSGTTGSVGDFQLNVSAGAMPPPVPGNDNCPAATAITAPFAAQVAIGTAGPDQSIACDARPDAEPASGGVWYVLTPASDGQLLFRSNGTPASFAVYEGPCEALTEVDCTGNNPGLVSVIGGRAYRILVARQQEDVSPLDVLDFSIDLVTPISPGEDCAGAVNVTLPLRGIMYTGLALNEGPADAPAGSCNSPDAQLAGMNHSVYLRFVAPSAGTLSGEFAPFFFFNQIMAVYAGSCGSLVEVACADEPQPMTFDVPTTAGTPYIIQVGSQGTDWIGDEIAFVLTFTPTTCPADFNGSGSVTVQDIFDFLGAYFAGLPNADFNDSGSVTVQDIFDFLAAYFTGC